MIKILQKKDPFQSNCQKPDCQPCRQAGNSGKLTNCRKCNICYEAKCKKCDLKGHYKAYHGESARNLYLRSKEHEKDRTKKKENSWMNKHIENDHKGEGESVEFEWKILGTFRKPSLRQISEAYHIDKKKRKKI